MKTIKTVNLKIDKDLHTVDSGGNHFVNGKCVNPLYVEGELEGENRIGSTYPLQLFAIVQLTKLKEGGQDEQK